MATMRCGDRAYDSSKYLRIATRIARNTTWTMRRPRSGECPILGVREMSNSYRVVIQATDETLTVRARVTIVNFQFPDVPINRCFALQLLADAYYYLKERPEETNLPGRDAAKLASRADPRLIAYAEQLQSRHDEAFNRQIAERAEAEIVRVVELEQCNFEATDAWHEANERGDQPSVPFAELDVSQVLEFRVADRRLIEHLAVGFTWETAMYARDETYSAG